MRTPANQDRTTSAPRFTVRRAEDVRHDDEIRLGVLLAIVVASSALVGLFLHGSGFTGSDFLSFREARRSGLSLGYLFRPVFDHVIPGHRFVNWLVYSVVGLDHRVAVLLSVVVLAATLLVLHRLLAELVRPGPVPLALTLLFGVSVIQVGTGQWWAAGLSRLPAGLFALSAILAHVRFRRTGRLALLVWSVVLVGLSLLFSEDGLLVPPLLLTLHILVLEAETPLRTALRAVLHEWWVWVPYLLPMAITLVASTSQTDVLYDVHSLGNLARYLATAWFQAFCPALIGQVVNLGALSAGEIAVVAVAQAVVLSVVGWTIWRRPAAWRAWLFFALGFLATQVPVGLVRTDFFPPELVALQLRYYSIAIALFTIALAAAVLPVRQRKDERPDGSMKRALPPASLARMAVGAAVLTVYAASSAWSAARLSESFDGRAAAKYLATLEHDLRRVENLAGGATLLDVRVPRFIVDPLYAPHNRVTTLVELLSADVRFGATADDLYRATDSGHLEPVRFTVKAGGPAVALATTPSFAVIPPESQAIEGDELCIDSGRPPSLIVVQLATPAEAGEWFLVVRYRAPESGLGRVLVEHDGQFVDDVDPVLPIVAERTESVVALTRQSFSRFIVGLPFDFPLCVRELALGLVERRVPPDPG